MASFQSHRLRHMTAQQGPKLTHLTFLSLITYMSSSGWGPLGVVLSHRKSYIIITFSKNCHSFSMCWRICPNNTTKDNRDYKGIKKLHLETNILIPFIFSGDLRNCLPELGNNFFTISLSTIILSFHLVLAIIKICKRKKYDPYSLKMHTKKRYIYERNLYFQNNCSLLFHKPFENMVSHYRHVCIPTTCHTVGTQ